MYTLSAPSSAGFSKSAGALKDKAPEDEPMDIAPASTPLNVNVKLSPSASVAETVPMLVEPSATENVFPLVNGALLPPPAPPELEPPLPPPKLRLKLTLKTLQKVFSF